MERDGAFAEEGHTEKGLFWNPKRWGPTTNFPHLKTGAMVLPLLMFVQTRRPPLTLLSFLLLPTRRAAGQNQWVPPSMTYYNNK